MEGIAKNWGWEVGRSVYEVGVGTGKPLTSEGTRHVQSQLVFHASDKR